MTPTHGKQFEVSFSADLDCMYEVSKDCVNNALKTMKTDHVGFVKLALTSKTGVHDLLSSAVVDKDTEMILSANQLKLELGKRFNNVIDQTVGLFFNATNASADEYVYGWVVKTEIVGPAVRLICDPLTVELEYPEIIFMCDEDDTNLEIPAPDELRKAEIDFVLAIPFPFWPQEASQWKSRIRAWPDMSLIEDVLQGGYHFVPKSPSGSRDELEWRFSFARAEGVLLRSIPKYSWCKQCYRIFKCFIKYHLSHPNLVSTYHCKTIVLWTLETYHQDTWVEANLGNRFLGLLDSLIHALIQGDLQQYFMNGDNLFESLNTDFALTVARKLSKMRKQPFEWIYRRGIVPWDDDFQGMTIQEMLTYDADKEGEEGEELYSRNG